jgi:hypothetical protein
MVWGPLKAPRVTIAIEWITESIGARVDLLELVQVRLNALDFGQRWRSSTLRCCAGRS